jgi:uncharacterized protein (TIGR03067 family)
MTLRIVAAVLAAGLLATAHHADGQPQPTGAVAAESLDGTWQVSTVIDDGQLINLNVVRDSFVKDGRLTIKNNVVNLTRPGRTIPREVAFVLDPTKSPKTIDLAGAENTGSKGIYLHGGDTMVLCLGGAGSQVRPSELSAPAGSGRLLITLTRVSASTPVATLVSTTPPPAPPLSGDDLLRKQLIGTWGHQDDHVVVYNTLNPDGTFSAITTWKKGFGRMFHDDVRTSGTWKVENGSLVSTVTASTDKELRGQILPLKVYTIDSREVVFTDEQNSLRREWKVR